MMNTRQQTASHARTISIGPSHLRDTTMTEFQRVHPIAEKIFVRDKCIRSMLDSIDYSQNPILDCKIGTADSYQQFILPGTIPYIMSRDVCGLQLDQINAIIESQKHANIVTLRIVVDGITHETQTVSWDSHSVIWRRDTSPSVTKPFGLNDYFSPPVAGQSISATDASKRERLKKQFIDSILATVRLDRTKSVSFMLLNDKADPKISIKPQWLTEESRRTQAKKIYSLLNENPNIDQLILQFTFNSQDIVRYKIGWDSQYISCRVAQTTVEKESKRDHHDSMQHIKQQEV